MSRRPPDEERFDRRIRRVVKIVSGLAVLGLVTGASSLFSAAPAQAAITTDAQSAAQLASAAGYRTGIAVLDLQTGVYYGAGEDTASFASESVAKIFIATELLLTGQMTGNTETTAYQMITQSDDDDADALYGLAGGDDVINLVAAHYNLPSLGTAPTEPGWWGNTEINAKAMVYLYAAIAKDPVVGPWLINAMANATEYGADGTNQFFGLPSATTGAAIKQGWGDDGDDSPNAVFNSTGYVDGDTYAVAILTDGPPSSYGSAISNMVTSEAKALMPGGKIDDPAEHNPVISNLAATTTGSTVHITGTAEDPDTSSPLTVRITDGTSIVASGTTGANNAFALNFLVGNGVHTYTVTVPNVGEGTADGSATTAAITVDGSPHGTVQSVVGGSGEITITGEVTNPNLSAGQDPRVSVTINGRSAITEVVDDPSAATASVTPATLADFSLVVAAPAGADQVAVTYDGTDGAANTTEGIWPVAVAAAVAPPSRLTSSRVILSVLAVVLVLVVGAAALRSRRAIRPRS